jgi:hypothetical protein
MHTKKLLILFIFSLLATPVIAGVITGAIIVKTVDLPPVNIQITGTSNPLSKLEQVLLYPENLLKRFEPMGATITNKRVSQNVISFTATKTKLFISKSVYVNGIFESSENKKSCLSGEVGFNLRMHFETSDSLVTDNVEELQAILCLKGESSSSQLNGTVRSKIVLGKNYSSLLGPKIVGLIQEQVNPLIYAITEELKNVR